MSQPLELPGPGASAPSDPAASHPAVARAGDDYSLQYADKNIKQEEDTESIDNRIRRLLRFYDQVGILIHKQLAEDDLVFALIGPGLEHCWPAVRSAIEWYQNYYGGITGF